VYDQVLNKLSLSFKPLGDLNYKNLPRRERRPRFEIGLDTHRLIERLDILSGLDEEQLERVAKLQRPRFTVPNERILRRGDRGDAGFFIASGAVEVKLPIRRVRLGSGEFFGEMALLSGEPRRADVVSLTYCRCSFCGKPILSVSSHQIRRPKRSSTASPRRVFRWTRRTQRASESVSN
jgi:hypothetical protein